VARHNRSMRTLYVAAGGGGDAVGALLARRALGDTDERAPLVTTCAWERLRIDPVPGPRARSDFTGLGLVGGEPCEVLPTSDTIPSGRSVLPRLAETSGARVFLHDFEGGAVGLTAQLQRLGSSLNVDHLIVVDVGGDIVARGNEAGLRSPLADSLTLAAALETKIPTSVVVLGPGADAELPERQVLGLLYDIAADLGGRVTAVDVRNLAPVLDWHPTEASAVAAAAATGLRGRVSMRRGRVPVPVTDMTPGLWIAFVSSWANIPLASALRKSESLPSAERTIRSAAVNEIDFERIVAEGSGPLHPCQSLTGVILEMESVGATHITTRRLSESLGARAFDVVAAHGKPVASGLWSVDELKHCNRIDRSPRP
jgi:hypothetical protein